MKIKFKSSDKINKALLKIFKEYVAEKKIKAFGLGNGQYLKVKKSYIENNELILETANKISKFTFLLMFMFITGCGAQGLTLNDRVKVIDGFYKGCEGIVTDEFSWVLPCQHKYFVEFTTSDCSDNKFISVCDLEKIE